jgi:hypothetical protein
MIRAETKRIVRALYAARCSYCGIPEYDVDSELTYDHHQPRSAGGEDSVDNLVYACHACNEFKGSYWPVDASERLPHPLHDDVSGHIDEAPDGRLIPLSSRGMIMIAVLNLNRAPLVSWRSERRLRLATVESQQALQRSLSDIRKRLDDIERQLRYNRN